jgi:signal transduction histidine kinase
MQAIENQGNIWVTSQFSGGKIIIEIRDDGKGMDQTTLDRLGEPFFTTKPVGSGIGLGLTISYGIVQREQGRLWFESKLGQGTAAFVELSSRPQAQEGS